MTLTTLATGDAHCLFGGVKITSEARSKDAKGIGRRACPDQIAFVCNGAPGAAGPAGPAGAAGAAGAAGPAGPAGP
ncbi:MAG TPA: hypothetical protein VFK90_07570, partial [Anaeromyxobacter sp.]|nr:hypothetical protein [Anaeromyxobacter sp.]